MENNNEKRQNELQDNTNMNMNNNQNIPETLKNDVYTPAFLKKHIGHLVKVEFLIGTTSLLDRTGILLEVGASYIVLRSIQDNNLLYCDLFSIKFVTISRQSFVYNPQIYDLYTAPYTQQFNSPYTNPVPNTLGSQF